MFLHINGTMSELKENDSSDCDNFMIKQIKPVNKKKTIKETAEKQRLGKYAQRPFLSNENKKRKNNGKLNTEEMPKEKRQNLTGTGNCFTEKSSRSDKGAQKSKKFHFINGTEISKTSLQLTYEENKLKDIQKNSGGEEQECFSFEIGHEKLPESINIINLPVHLKTKTRKPHSLNGPIIESQKFEKKVEFLPPICSRKRKKFKNNLISPKPLMANEFGQKPLPEIFVELCEDDWSKKKESKSEVPLNIIIHNKVKSKLEFEDSLNNQDNKFDKIYLNSANETQEEKYKSSSELLSFLLKNIVSNEITKQMEIEKESCRKGEIVERVLSQSECEILKNFLDIENNACKLFVRMLLRKNDWHRVSTIVYDDIDDDLEKYLNILERVNFINVNIEDEDFKTQLNLLKKPEVLKLCKTFNVCYKSHNADRKDTLIKSLIQECKNQKSVLDIMKGKNSNSRLDLLKSQIKNDLGMCIKINQATFQAFNKVILLFSFAHYFDEEERRLSDVLYLCFKIHKNIIQFPNYKLSPSVVFVTKVDFEEYKASLMLLNAFEVAVSSKNHDEFNAVVTEVKIGFKNLLQNYEYHKRFLSLPSFLQKFSAGTVYARILTKYCQIFKKKTNELDILKTVKSLLNQTFFLQRKRGDWYEILSKALENQKENNAAAEVIVKSLKDPLVNEVQRLTLQLRGQGILRRKTFGISDLQLKEVLNCECKVSVNEPASIEIKAKALEINGSGFRCVYVQDTEYGKKYTSVEETAILYYKSQGFPKGYHAEGSIIHTIYFMMFYNIIYGLSPEGVFQSPHQEAPLDFNSTSFYLNRKNEIDKLLSDMIAWDDMKVENTIKEVYLRNCNITCIINWDNEYTPEILCEVIKCITMPVLVLIFRRLLQNFRVYRSGFPDLTLWNSETNKIKFVEVKSPNDRLSPAQRIWLSYLGSIGLSSENHQAKIVLNNSGNTWRKSLLRKVTCGCTLLSALLPFESIL